MKFRPCIDIHKGEVKQIVGSTLSEGDISGAPVENFVSSRSTAEFAAMYSEDRLTGGHVIMLGGGCESAREGGDLSAGQRALTVAHASVARIRGRVGGLAPLDLLAQRRQCEAMGAS